ncbi:MAG: ribonuclease HII [Propionibacteriaceae bacterium]|nr:ribonuclease HII [Propionibacteriaceae bacterium]
MYEDMLLAAGLGPVAGVDEAGRGACAGPLVAAAVILSEDPAKQIHGLDDSKNLSEAQRLALFPLIMENAIAVSQVIVEARECDTMGIQEANIHALRQAVLELEVSPGFVITDGYSVSGLPMPSVGMWKGDKVSPCVSAASIIAKVTRDRIMDGLDSMYPLYYFSQHKGYATSVHQKVLDAYGPCPQHRLSYRNVARTTTVEES